MCFDEESEWKRQRPPKLKEIPRQKRRHSSTGGKTKSENWSHTTLKSRDSQSSVAWSKSRNGIEIFALKDKELRLNKGKKKTKNHKQINVCKPKVFLPYDVGFHHYFAVFVKPQLYILYQTQDKVFVPVLRCLQL